MVCVVLPPECGVVCVAGMSVYLRKGGKRASKALQVLRRGPTQIYVGDESPRASAALRHI